MCFPATAQEYIDRLRRASVYHTSVRVREHPVGAGGVIAQVSTFTLQAQPLDHRIKMYGWRVEEPERRAMLPDRLAAAGVSGPDVGRLQKEGARSLVLTHFSQRYPDDDAFAAEARPIFPNAVAAHDLMCIPIPRHRDQCPEGAIPPSVKSRRWRRSDGV